MKPRFWNTAAAATEHYLGIRWPRAIWQAVLEQAIRDITDGPSVWELRQMPLDERQQFCMDVRAAAERWVEDQENEPQRFVWVCEQLGLDPAAVRASIVRRTA